MHALSRQLTVHHALCVDAVVRGDEVDKEEDTVSTPTKDCENVGQIAA